MKNEKFKWHEFNLSEYISTKLCKQIIDYSSKKAVFKVLSPCSITSRESPEVKEVTTYTIDGNNIKKDLPYLFELYSSVIFKHAKEVVDEPVFLAEENMYAINLNVQKGTEMRYECHVDSNPLQGVLNITTHKKGQGGELVVSNSFASIGVDEIEKDCVVIYPEKGKLLLFDATQSPHYVRPLNKSDDIRVTMTMNFYTSSNPESARPKDLNSHLFEI